MLNRSILTIGADNESVIFDVWKGLLTWRQPSGTNLFQSGTQLHPHRNVAITWWNYQMMGFTPSANLALPVPQVATDDAYDGEQDETDHAERQTDQDSGKLSSSRHSGGVVVVCGIRHGMDGATRGTADGSQNRLLRSSHTHWWGYCYCCCCCCYCYCCCGCCCCWCCNKTAHLCFTDAVIVTIARRLQQWLWLVHAAQGGWVLVANSVYVELSPKSGWIHWFISSKLMHVSTPKSIYCITRMKVPGPISNWSKSYHLENPESISIDNSQNLWGFDCPHFQYETSSHNFCCTQWKNWEYAKAKPDFSRGTLGEPQSTSVPPPWHTEQNKKNADINELQWKYQCIKTLSK